MKVTPANKKFGKYAPGDEFEFPDRAAKVFIKLGKLMPARAQYMTRDMVAAPVQVVQQTAAPSFEPAAAPASPEPQPQAAAAADDLDSSGAAWDERMHSNTKARNADGTWRKRPGPRLAEE